MNQIIAVIRQYPLGVCEAFHAHGMFTALIEPQAHLFHNGLGLFGIASAADHEKIGKGGHFAQVQNTNVESFLRFRGSNSGEPRRNSV